MDDLLRPLVPRVLGVLVRRHGDFETCEDAVQEALIAAAAQWPVDGVPDNPAGWLITVASRRRVEMLRFDVARRRREQTAAALSPSDAPPVPAGDDTLVLLLLCCHPCLPPAAQTVLTLRAVAGLTTAEIARALLQPDAAVGQRISRAKQRLRQHGADFGGTAATPLPQRLPAVLQVLYFVFNEGYTATSGEALHRPDLSGEAIRLTRQLARLLPGDGEVKGLLALMLLTDARRPARTRPDGALVPLTEQDRTRWDRSLIAEGTALVADVLATAPVGPFQVQAAIAAVHDEAGRPQDTDWPQILGLYDLLQHLTPGPMVALSRSVAVAMVHGPRAGLELVAAVAPALGGHHRLFAVRAHLHELAGDAAAARDDYRRAAERTLSLPERRYLEARAGD
ncbi:RNA polymerase sigma factor [Dactylosporangium sp. NBC_01737]|uniref:RNA polymerase sigma factor n=1 Tax=Dactylosporangium sp. NBC_01737 TaxID=2975959 RepID=UPI003FA37943|nr:RNA polymerase sigma factor [Dactylosporangium sp. NBC_01737]